MRRASILLCFELALLLAPVGCERQPPNQRAPDPTAKSDQLASIVGKWEAFADNEKVSLEFTKTGTLHLAGNPKSLRGLLECAKILDEFGIAKPENLPIAYKPLEGNKLEVESDWNKLFEGLGGRVDGLGDANGKVREVLKAAVSETELTITNEREKSVTFKRGK